MDLSERLSRRLQSVWVRATLSAVAIQVSARKAAATTRKTALPQAPQLRAKNSDWTTANCSPSGHRPCGWSKAKASRQVMRVR